MKKLNEVTTECIENQLGKAIARPEDKKISKQYVGYLVGQLKEILEASVEPKEKCQALKNVLADKIYFWWDLADDPKTPDVANLPR